MSKKWISILYSQSTDQIYMSTPPHTVNQFICVVKVWTTQFSKHASLEICLVERTFPKLTKFPTRGVPHKNTSLSRDVVRPAPTLCACLSDGVWCGEGPDEIPPPSEHRGQPQHHTPLPQRTTLQKHGQPQCPSPWHPAEVPGMERTDIGGRHTTWTQGATRRVQGNECSPSSPVDPERIRSCVISMSVFPPSVRSKMAAGTSRVSSSTLRTAVSSL